MRGGGDGGIGRFISSFRRENGSVQADTQNVCVREFLTLSSQQEYGFQVGIQFLRETFL
jgi:hypothetical protein